jgi:hypothetical protein
MFYYNNKVFLLKCGVNNNSPMVAPIAIVIRACEEQIVENQPNTPQSNI